MALLIELTNASTGARRTLYEETDAPVPTTSSYSDVLEPTFYFGLIYVSAFVARPGANRQQCFDVFAAQCGGYWRQVRNNLWLHVERK
jgi:hypothetical protein